MKELLSAALFVFYSGFIFASPLRFNIVHPEMGYLALEVLDDDLVHLEISAIGSAPNLQNSIYTTPYINMKFYPGPTEFWTADSVFETKRIRLKVRPSTLCVEYIDKTWVATPAIIICPQDIHSAWKGLDINSVRTENIYGLGQYFNNTEVNGDWLGRVRKAGGDHGNAMTSFAGGATGNMQIPILYSIDDRSQTYAIFLDNLYKQNWDFKAVPWQVRNYGDQIRFYILSGNSLKDLRKDYMELVGRPPLPPKKAFGLWVSEYGYDNWPELYAKWESLKKYNFPLDGFVMDLQWFGGVKANSPATSMGKLTWDRTHFPKPEDHLKELADNGLATILIEESYIGGDLQEFNVLAKKNYLAKDCVLCGPTYLEQNPWWGKGGMMDWSNAQAGSFWHDWKRQPLVEMGVFGHWTDLGEPEMYNAHAAYYGFPELGKSQHADIHNIYNLLWHKSIAEGYERHRVKQRPFILSRSGGAGSQRYGVALWSGDIGSNLKSVAAHLKAQMHVGLSGIDYYGSDIGGFHRGALDGDLDVMYTRWFAISAMIDIPVRPHTENLCNCKETSPSLIGHVASNLANIRKRYELIPYYYSMARKSFLYGDLLIAPLFYHYPGDQAVRQLGSQKMIGPNLMVALNTSYSATTMDVYLPVGRWYDESSKKYFVSQGAWLKNYDLYPNDNYQLPLFVKAGAIIPKQKIPSDRPINALGNSPRSKSDLNPSGIRHTVANNTKLEIYEGPTKSELDLYDDDGVTIDYLKGDYSLTRIEQLGANAQGWEILIHPSQGDSTVNMQKRVYNIDFFVPKDIYQAASINGKSVSFGIFDKGSIQKLSLSFQHKNTSELLSIKLHRKN